ncbi:MAG: DUF3568 domain-containing protein [Opitutales bacterium]|nr:DUF3568 domain-containing protein [Opitutales bacterium]
MKNTYFRLVLSLVIAAFGLQSTGCVAIVAGGAAAAGTAYALGDLEFHVDASAKQVGAAIIAGGRDMRLNYISGAGDELAGKYSFRTADDRKVTITYKRKSDIFITVSIRVGNLGDEEITQQISQAIQKRL